MTSLVERLRNVTEDDAYALPWTFGETCREAAAEIDRLRRELEEARKALEKIAAYEPVKPSDNPLAWRFIKEARAALRAEEEGR
ncbi:hypothetical protein [Sinorhizobium meliloti]|uniref:hypothetical protein n=1 Tax=Rhizobium meliloti TaxID=382 RepID=UPI0012980BD0|nr:hypothetical protein [Sinorhizobium meliloti]MQX90271.1 hypothetical protein [Sinorhizobium meliloti]